MSARQWTREELDRVHPLRDGWSWAIVAGGCVIAVSQLREVWVDGHGNLNAWASGSRIDPPDDVALSVILANKGMDSFGAIADALASRRDLTLREAFDCAARGEMELSATCDGEANSYYEAAVMLRRGTVNP